MYADEYDDHAEEILAEAAAKATIRHILPQLLAAALSLAGYTTTWVLTFIGLAHLTGWWAVAGVGWMASTALLVASQLHRGYRHKLIEFTLTPTLSQAERKAKAEELFGSKRQLGLNWLLLTAPASMAAGYAISQWWPWPAATAAGVLSAAWPCITRRVLSTRRLEAAESLLAPKGPHGLPTPEV